MAEPQQPADPDFGPKPMGPDNEPRGDHNNFPSFADLRRVRQEIEQKQTVDLARGVIETGGPTALFFGAIGVGQFLKRVGDIIQGAAGSGGGEVSATTVEVDLGSTLKFTGSFQITDVTISAASKVLAWQAPGPYTGKGTLADEAELQPVQIVSVTPGAGVATVRWQTPSMLTISNVVGSGGSPKTVVPTQVGLATLPSRVKRLGLVRGSVKFSYVVCV